jgi:hypothetical protein
VINLSHSNIPMETTRTMILEHHSHRLHDRVLYGIRFVMTGMKKTSLTTYVVIEAPVEVFEHHAKRSTR